MGYQKAAGLMALVNLIFLTAVLCVKGTSTLWAWTTPVELVQEEPSGETEAKKEAVILGDAPAVQEETGQEQAAAVSQTVAAVSGQRVLVCEPPEQPENEIQLSGEELETLLRIVEAEAGSEDEDGRLLVANVVLNRVKNDKFPATVTEVVFQQSDGVTQFSPVASGRYYTVEISDETEAAVQRALQGEDISQGALYFASRKYAGSEKMRWFDRKLTFLFEHGGHEFFK